MNAAYSERTKEGLALMRRLLQRLMWRSTKGRVDEEASLPPVEHRAYRLTLNAFERQTYDARYRACHGTLHDLVARHATAIAHGHLERRAGTANAAEG